MCPLRAEDAQGGESWARVWDKTALEDFQTLLTLVLWLMNGVTTLSHFALFGCAAEK